MQWVLLIGDEISAKDFADMRFKNSSKVGSGEGYLSVMYEDGFAVFSDDEGDISCDYDEQELKEIERFFRSAWFGVLTSVDPDLLISKLRKEKKQYDY